MSQNFIIVIRNLGSVELAIVLLRAKAASMVQIASSGNGTKRYKSFHLRVSKRGDVRG